MSLDRFIRWQNKEKTPKINELHTVLEDFFNKTAEVTWNVDRILIDLPGKSCIPHRIFLNGHVVKSPTVPREERFIEIYVGEDNVDVITCEADEYTNTIAEGITKMIARLWEGKQE